MNTITRLLQNLVQRPSVNPMGRSDLPASITYEHRVTDFLESELTAAQVPYERINVAPGRDNIVATFTPKNATSHILFEAHQDTVPVDAMTIDPFGGVIENGKLYGRGACDVKAGVATMLAALLRLHAEKPATAAKVTVAFTVDEEHTFLGVQHLIASGVTADFAIVAEPTNLDIVTSHKGVARWTTTVYGLACHSSKPHEGVNAIYKMGQILGVIEGYSIHLNHHWRHPIFGDASISVGMIRGGTSANVVPDFCEIEIDRRMLPGTTAAWAMSDFDSHLRRHFEHRIGFQFKSKLTFACPALMPVPESNEHLQRLRSTIEKTHRKPSLISVPFGTDASSLAEAGIPSVVFGPGDIAQAHTKDEWVNLAEVEAAAEILYRFAVS